MSLYSGIRANLTTVTDEKQESLRDRFKRARKKRRLPPKEGHEVSVDGKQVRTPTEGEFFGNLEKASGLSHSGTASDENNVGNESRHHTEEQRGQ